MARAFPGDVGFAGNRWGMYNASMPQFAHYASNFLQKPVFDRTALEDAFDFRWTVPDADPNAHGDAFMDTFKTTFPVVR